jgi:hypothetical protein
MISDSSSFRTYHLIKNVLVFPHWFGPLLGAAVRTGRRTATGAMLSTRRFTIHLVRTILSRPAVFRKWPYTKVDHF